MSVKYSILEPSNLDEAAECVTSVFVTDEPLVVGASLSYEEYFPVIREVCRTAIQENLSWGCFDPTTNELLGCLVACDFTTPPPALDSFSPKIRPVYGLLGALDSSYSAKNVIISGEQLHVLFAAVKKQHRGKKIYQNLRSKLHDHAKQQGYKYALGEVTGLISQKVTLEKFDNEILERVVYSKFEFEGQRPFSKLHTPAECLLVRGKL